MATTPEQFQSYLTAPEGSRLEFKTAANNYEFDRLVEYCVAIANEGGGKIILGVTDRRPRKVPGTNAFAEPGRTEAGLYTALRHRIPVEEYNHHGTRVLIVHVPSRLPGTAWQHDGRFLKRAGDDVAGLGDAELKTMFAEAGPDFSAEPSDATMDELDATAIASFRSRWARKDGNPRIATWSRDEMLNAAELVRHGRPTIAALILFGKPGAIGQHLAQSELVFEYRSSETSGPAQEREEYRLGFFLFHDAIWQKINLRNDRQSYQDGLFRYDIPTFDETAVREALLNAVAHRDYRLGGSTFVRQFARRLEIVSPGGFPPGITPENVIDQQNPRNRRLAEALARCGLIERSGQGMNLMFETAIRQSKALPSFAGTAAHEVRLTLFGTVQNPAFVRFFEQLGQERSHGFSTHDFLALDALQRGAPVSPEIAACLSGLVEAGVVESVGRGRGVRYHLSRSLYAAIGAKGTYTRQRGLDHETNKELLFKHIQENNTDGSPLADLKQVLPSLSEGQVQWLVNQLRDEGRVIVRGQRRWARWHLAKAVIKA